MVQPVSIPFPAPGVAASLINLVAGGGTNYWLPTNLADFPAVAGDLTAVNPSGTPQAFALSLADVVRLSTPEGPFPNGRARMGGRNSHWRTRTPTQGSATAWGVGSWGNGAIWG